MRLTDKKCTPCQGGVEPLDAIEAYRMLTSVPGWQLIDGGMKIQRRFSFINFVDAMRFAHQVGKVAEQEGHHPDVTVGWGYCNVVTYTHKIGGLHENDFILASKINTLE